MTSKMSFPWRIVRLSDQRPDQARTPQADETTGGDVVVFSSGASRGATQVGMLRALYDHGVRPSAVIGCSVGSLNAAWFAADPSVRGIDSLEELWLSTRWQDIYPITARGAARAIWRQNHLASNEGVRRLTELIPVRDVADTLLPLRVVTTDLLNGHAVVHRSGDISQVLLASCAIPGVFPPVQIGTSYHIDGGSSAAAPVHLADEFLPRRVFLLDSTGSVSAARTRSALGVFLTGARYSASSQVALARERPGVTTIGLEPASFHGQDAWDFTATSSAIRAGYAAARSVLDAY